MSNDVGRDQQRIPSSYVHLTKRSHQAFVSMAVAVPSEAVATTTLATAAPLHEEFVKLAMQELQKVTKWTQAQVLEPLQKLGLDLIKKLEALMAPHMKKLQDATGPHVERCKEALVPHVKQFLAYQAQCVGLCEPYVAQAQERLVKLKVELQPHAEATSKLVVEKAKVATAQLAVHGALVKKKSEEFLLAQSAAGGKALAKLRTEVQVYVLRNLKLTEQIWTGALAGAMSAHRSAQAVHEMRRRTTVALEEKALALKAEDFDRAKLAKAAEIKLAELAAQAESLVFLKAKALQSLEYAAAHGYQVEFDGVMAESELELNAINPRPTPTPVAAAPAPEAVMVAEVVAPTAEPSPGGGGVEAADGEVEVMVEAAAAEPSPKKMNGVEAAAVSKPLSEMALVD